MKRTNKTTMLTALLLASSLLFPSCTQKAPTGCEIGDHTWKNATCLEAQVCELCGETVGEAVGHKNTQTELILPTCTEAGRQTWTCDLCLTAQTTEIPAPGHVEGPGMCLTCGIALENKIKNVIYIIGDGMGKEHITAGELAYGELFDFTSWKMASSNTNSLDSNGCATVLTDSAASGTALATGVLTTNGMIGMNQQGEHVDTILDFAQSLGKSTGVLTTDQLFGATPGAFSGHVESRDNTARIITTQIQSGVNFLAGSTDSSCTKKQPMIKKNEYKYAESLEDARGMMDAEKLYCQLDLEGNFHGDTAVKLADATSLALDFLSKDEDGFVLMIEQAHIDKYSHNNDFVGMIGMVKSLDETVDVVMQWIGDRTDTLVIITADHETGGLCVSSKENALANTYTTSDGTDIYYSFHSGGHTDADVGMFMYGTSYDFSKLPFFHASHMVKNSDIPVMIKEILSR